MPPHLENGCAGQRTGLDRESGVHNFPSAMTCDLQEDVLTRGCGQLGESRGLAEPRPRGDRRLGGLRQVAVVGAGQGASEGVVSEEDRAG